MKTLEMSSCFGIDFLASRRECLCCEDGGLDWGTYDLDELVRGVLRDGNVLISKFYQ